MTFIWPWVLLTLFLLLPGLLLYGRAQRRRRRMTANLGTFGLLQDAGGRALGWRRHLPVACSLLGLGVLFFALARPQMPLSLPRLEGTVILAFDVSASMAADDLEPTRMEAAQAAAEAFIQQQPETVRIGILTFSEGGMLVQPPTNDRLELLQAVNRLAPQSGTSVGQGILAALNTILTDGTPPANAARDAAGQDGPTPAPTPLPSGSFDNAVIVLITDGENMSAPDPLEAAERAADYGVRVHTVGVGSTAGTTVEIDGMTVATRLDETLLRDIAELTNGTYYRAASREDLTTIYTSLARSLTVRAQPTEITALVAGFGLVLLLAGGSLSLLWFGRMP